MFSMGKREILLLVILLLILFPPGLGTIYENSQYKAFDITSFFTKDRDVYFDYLGKTYYSDSVFLWNPDNDIKIKGLGITGNVTGTGNFEAHLVHNDNSYLISSFILENETVNFSNYCQETCFLPGFESDKYIIKFITEGVVANLNSLVYSVNPLNETPITSEVGSSSLIISSSPDKKVKLPLVETQEEFTISEGVDDYTKLMLHLNGDFSSSQHEVIFNGNPILNSSAPANNTEEFDGSLELDGSGDYLYIPKSSNLTLEDDFVFNSEFTLEFWMKADGDNVTIIKSVSNQDWNSASFGDWVISLDGNQYIKVNIKDIGTLTSDSTISLNNWHHIAFVRDIADLYLYVNGVRATSTIYSEDQLGDSKEIEIGRSQTNLDNSDFNGNLDEVRVSTNNRWGTNFTPSTLPYESDSETKLLLHLDGDDSTSEHPITVNGNPIWNSSDAPSTNYSGSMNFDGSDYLSIPDSDDWDFGTGEFTIDGWFKWDSTSGVQEMITHGGNGGVSDTAGWSLLSEPNRLDLYMYDNTPSYLVQIDATGLTINPDTWYHVAVTRNSTGSVKLYLDGVIVGTDTYSGTLSYGTSDLRLGTSHEGNRYFTGSMDEIRISKGIARWDENFTIEDNPFSQDPIIDQIIINSTNTSANNTFNDLKCYVNSSDDNAITYSGDWELASTPFFGHIWNVSYDSGNSDTASEIIVDNGYVYVTGNANNGDRDYYTVKYDLNGNHIWNITYDSGNDDIGSGIAVDSSNSVYVTGRTFNNLDWDFFTIKYDSNGNHIWNITYDSGNDDIGSGIAVDSSNSVYVTGTSNNGSDDNIFTIKYDSNGNHIWNRTYGKDYDDNGNAIVIDDDKIYVAGNSQSASDQDLFIIKYDSNGNHIWNITYDSGGEDFIYDIDVDPFGYVHITGEANGAGYTAKYSSSGNLMWSSDSGTSGVASDLAGNTYIIGSSLIKYNSTGGQLKSFSVPELTLGYDVEVDSEGNVYLAGRNNDGTNNFYFTKYKDGFTQTGQTPSDLILADTLNSSFTSVGDLWRCCVQAFDGFTYSARNCSDYIEILKFDRVGPDITFVPPTPENNTNLTYGVNNTAIINVSIEESNLSEVIWNWNGTNYSMYDDSLLLMMSLNGDASSSKHDVTFNGNPQLVTNGYYDGAYEFDGSGDYLSIADTDDTDFGSGDFTVDFWAYTDTPSTMMNFFSLYDPVDTDAVLFRIDGSGTNVKLYVNEGSTPASFDVSYSFPTSTWTHMALVRESGNTSLYINGVYQDSTTAIGTIDTGTNLIIGARLDGTTQYWNGYIDEFRISKGVARWTSNFDVPTSSYSPDANTKLLLHMDGDLSLNPHNATLNGNVILDAIGKYGGAYSFDGSEDINLGSNEMFNFDTGDSFSFELYFKTGTSAFMPFFQRMDDSTAAGYFAYLENNIPHITLVNNWGSANRLEVEWAGGTVNDNEWHHLVYTYDGSGSTTGTKVYLDGVENTQQNTNNLVGSISASGEEFVFGKESPGWNIYYTGLMDEIRIWNKTLTPTEIQQQYKSNLQKYNSTQWYLYSNQSNLTVGNYTYKACAYDLSDNENCTEQRVVNILEAPVNIANAFIATWNTSKTSTGSSNSTTIALPLESSGTYNFTVYWGDGSSDEITNWNQPEVNHTYALEGEYQIYISGTIEGFRFNDAGDKLKIINIEQWGDLNVGNSNRYFLGCSNLDSNATDALNLTGTTTLFHMFNGATSFNGNVSTWDVSSVTNMGSMFSGATSFDQDLSNWNVSSVTDMSSMFSGATSFNGNVSTWDVSSVTNLAYQFYNANSFDQDLNAWNLSIGPNVYGMFLNADIFNGNISSWDVSSITNMGTMFRNADSFNQDLSNWNVSSVTDMSYMFWDTDNFNGNISSWDVSNVNTMERMFYSTDSFDQDLSSWDVSSVANMRYLFSFTNIFNGNVSTWDVSGATDLAGMFSSAISFNQDLNNWNVSSVTNMGGMFSGATSFNQDLSNWNVSGVTDMNNMFTSVKLSIVNYDSILNGWANLSSLIENVTFSGGNSQYCLGESSRNDVLINIYNWTITDGGKNCTDYDVELNIFFVDPTPDNNTNTTNTSVEINVSIEESNLSEVIWNWNGTNYSMYDDSLLLMMSLNGDASSSKHDVTFNGNPRIVTEGYFDGAYEFDGSGDYLSVSDSNDWDLTSTNLTIDMWIKHTDHSGDEIYIAQTEEPAITDLWDFGHIDGTGLRYRIISSSSQILGLSGGEITDNNWHHVALVKVGNEYGIYKDGNQVAYVSDGSTRTTSAPLIIGAQSTVNRYFDGNMDEVRISHTNRFNALPDVGQTDTITIPTKSSVSDPNTKLLLHMDGDLSLNPHNATANGDVTITDGKYSQCYDFDGSGDYIRIPDHSNLNLGTGPFTLNHWFNLDNTARHSLVTKWGAGGPSNYGFDNYIRADGLFRLCVGDNTCFGSYQPSLNTWHMGTVVRNSTGFYIYIDGDLKDSWVKTGVTLSSSFDLAIGGRYGGDELLDGSIDDVKIWNREFTPEEVQQQYISNLNKFNSTQWYFYSNQSNLSVGNYTYQAFAEDASGNVNATEERIVNILELDNLPNVTNFNGSNETTNFSSEPDINNVTSLTLANNFGRIKFLSSYGINAENQDYNTYVKIGLNFVSVNTPQLDSTFNNSANITLNYVSCNNPEVYYGNGTYNSNIEIIQENHPCNSTTNPSCTNIQCANNVMTFTISHFTGFASNGVSNLTIWDDADAGMPYNGFTRHPNETVNFFANYTNLTDIIVGANCSIIFSDEGVWKNMSWNNTKQLYEYNRTFTSIGNYTYNITCNATGYDELNATDDISISTELPCDYYLDSCKTSGWESNKRYCLNASITQAINGNCMEIDNNSLSLNGMGFSINSSFPSQGGAGVRISNYNNITLLDLNISKFLIGIYTYLAEDIDIQDSILFNNTGQNIQLYTGSHRANVESTHVYNSQYGILIRDSINTTLTSNHVYNNTNRGIYIYVESNGSRLTSNHVYDNYRGISFETTSNSTLLSNEVYYSTLYGIAVDTYSEDVVIKSNYIYNNSDHGIILSGGSDNIKVTKNDIDDNGNYGIWVYDIPNTIIKNNRLDGNTQNGIHIRGADANNTLVQNNNVSHSSQGIYNYGGGTNCSFINNRVHNCSGYAIHLYGIENNSVRLNDVYNSSSQALRLSNTENSTISSNNIVAVNSVGIYLAGSSNIIIKNNEVFTGTTGLQISSSSINNTVINNNISYCNDDGIQLYSQVYEANITDNNIFNNGDNGIWLYNFCDNNSINNNDIYNNTLSGFRIQSSINNTIESNRIFNNTQSGINIYSNSERNIIKYNNISDNLQSGIYSYSNQNNTIKENNIYDNIQAGILLQESSNNTIKENNIYNNTNQIRIVSTSSNNELISNSIWNNTFLEIRDDTASQYKNYLIYNNSEGKIEWTNASFLGSLNADGKFILGNTIIIENNYAELDPNDFIETDVIELTNSKMNSLANITFYNMPQNFTLPQIVKDGTPCRDCYNFTSLNAATVKFNVSSWSNYTIQESPFISLWNTSKTSAGSSNSTTIALPLEVGGTYNFTVYWGDGSSDVITTWNQSEVNHTYVSEGEYQVKILGTIVGFRFGNAGDKLKIIDIQQWGPLRIGNSGRYFRGCENLNVSAHDNLDLTGTTSLSEMFRGATNFNGNINHWDISGITSLASVFYDASSFNQDLSSWNTSGITTMSTMFRGATSFNQDLSAWDTSNVEFMNNMFWGASSFNQSLNGWDVSNVENMYAMFLSATSFDQDLDQWDTSNVEDTAFMFDGATNFNGNVSTWNTSKFTTMRDMFNGATVFNQNLDDWDVSNVTNMQNMFWDATNFNGNVSSWNTSNVENMNAMFDGASSFNKSLNDWDVSNVTNMANLFNGATSFDQDLDQWDTSKVTTMRGTFWDATNFNGNISAWDVSNVEDMYAMFLSATSFNQDLSSWNTSQVTQMPFMFEFASSFNQDLSSWDVSNVENMYLMFNGATVFNQDLSSWDVSNVENMGNMFHDTNLSTSNYDFLLEDWSKLPSLQYNVSFYGTSASYCLSGKYRNDTLIDIYNWTITDNGKNCDLVYFRNCTNITTPGNYFLANHINDTNTSYCINIQADDVTLDCQDNWIDASPILYTDYAIHSENNNNITTRNCQISGFRSPIVYSYTDNSELYNINLYDDLGQEIYIGYSENLTIYNITLLDTRYGTGSGFYVRNSLNVSLRDSIITDVEYGYFEYTPLGGTVIENTVLNGSIAKYFGAINTLDGGCNVELINVTDGERPVLFYNDTVQLHNWNNNFSEISFCEAHNSTISNFTYDGKGRSTPIQVRRTENATFTNFTIENVRNGVYYGAYYNYNCTFTDINIYNFSGYGVLLRSSYQGNFHDFKLINPVKQGYGVYSYHTYHYPIPLNNFEIVNTTRGVYLVATGFVEFENLTILNSDSGIAKQHPYQDNTFTNFTITNINGDGINLWGQEERTNDAKDHFKYGEITNVTGHGIYTEHIYNNIYENISVQNASKYGVNITGKSYNISLINVEVNESLGGLNVEVYNDTYLRRLVYNNSQARIEFTNENFRNNLSLGPEIIVGQNIFLENNLAGVKVENFTIGNINSSANITLKGLITYMIDPFIAKNGEECLDCYNFTSLNAGNVSFNVSSWSNYSILDATCDYYINDCKDSSWEENKKYCLMQDTASNNTCFDIKDNNITLNCLNNNISYNGSSVAGYRILSKDVNGTIIKNCNIKQGGSSSYPAIYYENSNDGRIYNNSVNSYDSNSAAIYIREGSYNLVDNNTIVAGSVAGIYMTHSSDYNNLSYNTINNTKNSYSDGIEIGWNSEHNLISNNIIDTTTPISSGIYLSGNTDNNTIDSNSIRVVDGAAVTIRDSENCNITNNRANSTRYNSYIVDGNTILEFNHSFTNNLAEGKLLNYSFNRNNEVFNNIDFTSYGQVIFASSNNITISNSNFSDREGLSLLFVKNSSFENNNILSKTGVGLLLSSESNYNTIYNNTIVTSNLTDSERSHFGISLANSNNNNVSKNKVNTSSLYGYGLYLLGIQTHDNLIKNNEIFVGSGYANTINMYSNANNNIINNNNLSCGPLSGGIYSRAVSNNNITNNILDCPTGITLYSASSNFVSSNVINSYTIFEEAVNLIDSRDNILYNLTLNSPGQGIKFDGADSSNNSLIDVKIFCDGSAGTKGISSSTYAGTTGSNDNEFFNILIDNCETGIYIGREFINNSLEFITINGSDILINIENETQGTKINNSIFTNCNNGVVNNIGETLEISHVANYSCDLDDANVSNIINLIKSPYDSLASESFYILQDSNVVNNANKNSASASDKAGLITLNQYYTTNYTDIGIADVGYHYYNATLKVTDVYAPTFTQIPNNKTLEYYVELLSVDFNTTDNVATDEFFVNNSDFIINASGALKNNTILHLGTHILNISANDTSGNINWTLYQVIVQDTINPIVNLVAPSDNEHLIEGNLNLVYNVSDYSTIANCSLYIDNILNNTNNIITKDVNMTFTIPFLEGLYTWYVNCSDVSGNTNVSGIRNLNITKKYYCGDSLINYSEQCDRSNLNGKTCKSLGYDKGSLSCSSDCNFDTSDCEYSKECDDTCESKGYECGIQRICTKEVNCGTCGESEDCISGKCVYNCNECVLNEKRCTAGDVEKCVKVDGCNTWELYDMCSSEDKCVISSCENEQCVYTNKDCSDDDLCTDDYCENGICKNEDIICEEGECDEGKCIFEVELFAPEEEEEETSEEAEQKGSVVCMKAEKYVETKSYPSENIKLEKGKSFVVEPMILDCNDESIELNLAIPQQYEEYEIHLCRGGSCANVEYYNETTYKCNDVVQAYTRKTGVYKPKIQDVENYTAVQKLDYLEKEITLDKNKAIFSGEYYRVKGRLKYLTTSINEAENKFVKIIGSPVVLETRDLIPLGMNLTLYYNNISNVDESSISIFALVDGKWKYYGGKIDTKSKTITAEIKDLDKLNGNEIVFATMANICDDCTESKLEKVYSSEDSDTAVIFVHGFNGKVEAYTDLFNEFGLTRQDLDIYAFTYQQNVNLDVLTKEFAEAVELNSAPYDKMLMIGHSVGGIIIQKAMKDSYDMNKSYVKKLKSMVLIGVPNKGLPYLDGLSYIIDELINTDTLKTLFNLESPLVSDVKREFETIEKIPNVNYYVIAGTEPYKLDLKLLEIDTSYIFNIEGTNDGLVKLDDAREIGGEKLDHLCYDYWELNLTHSQIDEADASRQLMKQIIAKDADLSDNTFVYAKKVRVVVDNCQKGDVLYVSGVKNNRVFVPECFGERFAPKTFLDEISDTITFILRLVVGTIILAICGILITQGVKSKYFKQKYPFFFKDEKIIVKDKPVKSHTVHRFRKFNRKVDRVDSEYRKLHEDLNKR